MNQKKTTAEFGGVFFHLFRGEDWSYHRGKCGEMTQKELGEARFQPVWKPRLAIGSMDGTLPETNIFAPENGWLED